MHVHSECQSDDFAGDCLHTVYPWRRHEPKLAPGTSHAGQHLAAFPGLRVRAPASDPSRVHADNPAGESCSDDRLSEGDESEDQLIYVAREGARCVHHVFSDALLAHDAVNLKAGEAGFTIEATPMYSDEFGDLLDFHTWNRVSKSIKQSNAVTIWTPPTSTFHSHASEVSPAIRKDEGQQIFGTPEALRIMGDEIKSETLIWLRTADELVQLTAAGRPWVLLYQAEHISEETVDIEPDILVGVKTLFDTPGVSQVPLKLNSMYLRVVWFGFHWTPAEYSSLDGLYLHCLRECSRPDLDAEDPPPLEDDACAETEPVQPPWRTAAVARNWHQKMEYVDRLKPADPNSEKRDFEAGCIGGLRRTHTALQQLPHVRKAGLKVRGKLDAVFDSKPEIEDALLQVYNHTSGQ